MQLKPIHALDHVIIAPLMCLPIRARNKEAMQHGQKHRPLHRKPELAVRQKPTQHLVDTQSPPQLIEHQDRPSLAHRSTLDIPRAVGINDVDRPAKAP